MKIAALVMAHTSPQQLEMLLRRLQGPLWRPFVHLDRKSDPEVFASCRTLATFLQDRVTVNWGGYSIVRATLQLLRHSLTYCDCTHFYLMSGQCFPIKSDQEIIEYLSSPENDGNFITANSMLHLNSSIPLWRLEYFAFNDLFPKGMSRFVRTSRLFLPKKSSAIRLLRGMVPYAGSQFWLINRSTAAEIVRFVDHKTRPF